jgi:hypothetical protein
MALIVILRTTVYVTIILLSKNNSASKKNRKPGEDMRHIDVTTEKIKEDNYKVFALLSNYLNRAPDYISREEIDEIVKSGVSYEYAFAVILAAAFGLDIVDDANDKDLFNKYFIKMFHKLDVNEYASSLFKMISPCPYWLLKF